MEVAGRTNFGNRRFIHLDPSYLFDEETLAVVTTEGGESAVLVSILKRHDYGMSCGNQSTLFDLPRGAGTWTHWEAESQSVPGYRRGMLSAAIYSPGVPIPSVPCPSKG